MKLNSIIAILGIATVTALANEKPPADALPLSKVVKMVEDQGYNPFIEANFDDGKWEVEAYKGDAKRELRVNAKSGKIESDRADD
ncbi:PepSY domain-containing protein [Rubritalea sp.]|uniref:PepSY domain-containing protein n=1 Tax=Rubritalea sp. TaxID=2109375 RepID=UPI003EFB2436